MATTRLWKTVMIVGDGGCGKMCLYSVFIHKEFPETYTPVVTEKWLAEIEVDDIPVELELRYVACQDSYDRLRPLSYTGTDVIIMCFAIDNIASLNNIQSKWHPEVKRYCPNVPIILVGNKVDTWDEEYGDSKNMETKDMDRFVTQKDGAVMAKKIGAQTYVECSAKTGFGVKEVFATATRAALNRNKSVCTIL